MMGLEHLVAQTRAHRDADVGPVENNVIKLLNYISEQQEKDNIVINVNMARRSGFFALFIWKGNSGIVRTKWGVEKIWKKKGTES